MSTDLSYHRHLASIATQDVNYVLSKDTQYAGSWKRRGGVGAWFTIVRPWDRLENMVTHPRTAERGGVTRTGQPHDIFSAIEAEGLKGDDGTVIACVRDLRRYLLLVEAHMTEELQKHFLGTLTLEIPDMSAEAVLDLARRSEHLRELASLEYPEPSRPGTPEDGGQHARQEYGPFDNMYPWIATKSEVPGDCADAWNDSGPVRVLEPFISHDLWQKLPHAIRPLYDPIWPTMIDVNGHHYGGGADNAPADDPVDRPPRHMWLDVKLCPPGERDRWPVLAVERNLHEWISMGPWAGLYDWNAQQSKFVLRDAHKGWGPSDG